jgi:hypothetical protein
VDSGTPHYHEGRITALRWKLLLLAVSRDETDQDLHFTIHHQLNALSFDFGISNGPWPPDDTL